LLRRTSPAAPGPWRSAQEGSLQSTCQGVLSPGERGLPAAAWLGLQEGSRTGARHKSRQPCQPRRAAPSARVVALACDPATEVCEGAWPCPLHGARPAAGDMRQQVRGCRRPHRLASRTSLCLETPPGAGTWAEAQSVSRGCRPCVGIGASITCWSAIGVHCSCWTAGAPIEEEDANQESWQVQEALQGIHAGRGGRPGGAGCPASGLTRLEGGQSLTVSCCEGGSLCCATASPPHAHSRLLRPLLGCWLCALCTSTK